MPRNGLLTQSPTFLEPCTPGGRTTWFNMARPHLHYMRVGDYSASGPEQCDAAETYRVYLRRDSGTNRQHYDIMFTRTPDTSSSAAANILAGIFRRKTAADELAAL